MCSPLRQWLTVQADVHRRADYRNKDLAVETQDWTCQSHLEPRLTLSITHETVRQAEREIIHWSRGRHADAPVADPAGIVLYCRLYARTQNINGVCQY